MSTLVAQTISNGTVSTSSANVIQGSAKAWVNFNGTTSPPTIRAQYNVSSVTKNGTGDYTVNFTNALTDTNYVTLVSGARSSTNDDIRFGLKTSGTYSTSAVQIFSQVSSQGASSIDGNPICVSVFR